MASFFASVASSESYGAAFSHNMTAPLLPTAPTANVLAAHAPENVGDSTLRPHFPCDAIASDAHVDIAIPFTTLTRNTTVTDANERTQPLALHASIVATHPSIATLDETASVAGGDNRGAVHAVGGFEEVCTCPQLRIPVLVTETVRGNSVPLMPHKRYELPRENLFPVPNDCCSMQHADTQPTVPGWSYFLPNDTDRTTARAEAATLDAETTQLSTRNTGKAESSEILILQLDTGTESLSLVGCPVVTSDVRFSHLSALRQLDVSGNACISNAAVESLPHSLQVLSLGGCIAITAEVRFTHLPALTTVDLSSTFITDAAIASLPHTVTELLLNDCMGITAAGRFNHLPALERIWLSGCTSISDDSIASLPPTVTLLHLEGCTSVSAAVSFAHLPSLEELWLTGAASTSDSVASSLPLSLKVLSLHGCTATTMEFVGAEAVPLVAERV